MQRRQFIRRSGSMAAAAAGLPLLKKLMPESPLTYKGEKLMGNSKWNFELSMFDTAISRFSAATEEQKKLLLKADYRKNASNATADGTGSFSFQITEVLLLESSPKKAEIKCKKLKRDAGQIELPSEMPANFKAIVRPYLDATIQDAKGNKFAELKYSGLNTPTTSSDDDEDCFLTTACVHHKGLKDDCYELETLRLLREDFMRNTVEGNALIEGYAILGPSIVNAIRTASNREEILEYLYQHLVIPGVQLTEAGRHSEAVEHYRLFVEEMEKKYLIAE